MIYMMYAEVPFVMIDDVLTASGYDLVTISTDEEIIFNDIFSISFVEKVVVYGETVFKIKLTNLSNQEEFVVDLSPKRFLYLQQRIDLADGLEYLFSNNYSFFTPWSLVPEKITLNRQGNMVSFNRNGTCEFVVEVNPDDEYEDLCEAFIDKYMNLTFVSRFSLK